MFRAHLRTTFHGWRRQEILWTALFSVVFFLLGIREPFQPPVPDGPLPLRGGPGTAHTIALAVAVVFAFNLWGGSTWGSRSDEGRRQDALLALPMHRGRHHRLRILAGLTWIVGLTGLALALGAAGEWAVTGSMPSASPAVWIALALSPGLVVLVAVPGLGRAGRPDWMSGIVLGAVMLLYMPGGLSIPEEPRFVFALFHGPLGVVTAFAGAHLGAVVLWGAVFGARVWWAGRRLRRASRGGTGSVERSRTTEEDWRRKAAGPGATPGHPLAGPGPGGRLRAELRTATATVTLGEALLLVFAWGILTISLVGDARLLDPSGHWEATLSDPLRTMSWSAFVLAFLWMFFDHDRLAPRAFPRLGALPSTRRGQVLTRVAAAMGLILVGATVVGSLLVTISLATGTGTVPTAGQLLNSFGLMVLVALAAGAIATAFDSYLAVFLVPPVVLLLVLLPAAGVVAPILGAGGMGRAEVLATLYLVPAFEGQPTPGTALALGLWIIAAAGALWFATGMRDSNHS